MRMCQSTCANDHQAELQLHIYIMYTWQVRNCDRFLVDLCMCTFLCTHTVQMPMYKTAVSRNEGGGSIAKKHEHRVAVAA
jgi:hypothetical protein